MARYTASVIFADGDQFQTVAKGNDDDHTTGVLRMEAIAGMREMLDTARFADPEATEVADALDRMDDQ